MERQKEISDRVIKIINEKSSAERLVRLQDIITELKKGDSPEEMGGDGEAHLEALLRQMLLENHDLRVIAGRNGISYYYSARSISDTYAGMLADKTEDPRYLIARIVRENSRLYPRPVPLVSFEEPPFDFTRETLAECLAALQGDWDYQDIRQTITSAETVFLYSDRHLDSDYAAMLAEWMDVGQVNNP